MPGFKFFQKSKKEGSGSESFGIKEGRLEPAEAKPAPEKETAKELEKIVPEVTRPENEALGKVSPAFSAQPAPPAQAQPLPKSGTLLKIEGILAEDLKEIYASMDEPAKRQFRAEGERVAGKIELIIQQVKVKVKKILDLIRIWLTMIPGVNKYFIEQETKIKLDKIMALRKH